MPFVFVVDLSVVAEVDVKNSGGVNFLIKKSRPDFFVQLIYVKTIFVSDFFGSVIKL